MTSAAPQAFKYPSTRKSEHTDTYHGETVADPYRWLEDDPRTSKEVENWIDDQNKVTFSFLEGIAAREKIKTKLTAIWNYEKFSAPWKVLDRYFYYRNDGLQNQSVLYTTSSLDLNAESKILLDPNTLAADGTVAISGTAVSDNARYIAYGRSQSGSDWVQWKIRDINTLQDLPDTLDWVKFSGAAWTSDSKGFFYGRFDKPEAGQEFQSTNKFMKVYYHRLFTSQEDDVLVYHRPDEPDYGFSTGVTDDGRYLIITTWKGTDDNYLVSYKDLWEPYGCPIDLIDKFENEYSIVGNEGPIFYFKSNKDAPRYKILAADTRKPKGPSQWREVLPQSEHVLDSVSFIGSVFVCTYMVDACTQVKLYTTDGKFLRDVALPGVGTAGGFGGRQSDTFTFFSFSSYAVPPSIYTYNILSGEAKLFRKSKANINSDDFTTIQTFYNSKDGTKVPIFITHKKDLALPAPTLLYGYGGFNISLTPSFSISVAAWLQMGGVYAVACIRGGGEYGKEWHNGARKLKRPNAFDDFIGAGEWLISNNYAKKDALAIHGGSNGGLLVAACMLKRPELFTAVIPAVGVMDMLRFHKFTAGKYWVDDYGSVEDSEEFKVLRSYSPYHNVKPAKYPAVLITTADTDDRVIPAHSFKFAAAIQPAQTGDAPVLIRVETKAGHGAGKPTTKVIEEASDKYAFLVQVMKMNPKWLSE